MAKEDAGRYQGCANYPTWAVTLWIDNEQGSYLYFRERAQEAWDNAEATSYSTREEQATRALADEIEEWAEEQAEPMTSGASMLSDVMTWALGMVEWSEIAEGMLEEVDKSGDDEEEDDDEEDDSEPE